MISAQYSALSGNKMADLSLIEGKTQITSKLFFNNCFRFIKYWRKVSSSTDVEGYCYL